MATILIVDDRPIEREFLVTLLGYFGHRLLEASNGAAALELVRSELPDLVIIDMQMPVLDGYQFLRHLRSDPLIARAKVLVYAVLFDRELLEQTFGVSHALRKPTPPEQIVEAVNELLRNKNRMNKKSTERRKE